MVDTQTPASAKNANKPQTEKPEDVAAKTGTPGTLIEHVEVEVEVLLGEARITVAELSALAIGDVLPVDRSIADAADIRVNGRLIARGEIVTVGDRFAVRVTEIGA